MTIPPLHTVLGASGATGRAVIQALQDRNLDIRAVGRSIAREDTENVRADLLGADEAQRAIEGSSHVYLCVGLPYRAKVWLRDWPRLMQNVIDACAAAEARLIFFDNVYMYGPPPLAVPFDESHPQQPVTKKGKARKQTADLFLKAVDEGKVKGLIGRSADFYGPYAVYSPFYISFLERMLEGKAPQALARPGVKHTYAYTLDNGRALVALALDESTYGEVWHLPVGRPITIEEVVEIFNEHLGTNYEVSFLPPFLQKLLSLFMTDLREAGKMNYQFETEYIMSYDKFKNHFPEFRATPYEEGIEKMIASFKENGGIR